MFDAEYDEGESTYFDDLKGEMHKQAQVRKLRSHQPHFKAVIQCCESLTSLALCSLIYFCASRLDSKVEVKMSVFIRVYSCSPLFLQEIRRYQFLFCTKN